MADQHPSPASSGPVEYLGPNEPPRRGRGRSGLVTGGAAAFVALGAAGAWGVASFMSGGQEAAEVVPGDALAYVSLNLDPDGGQKLEAYQTLKKFPALDEYLDASSGGEDLRRALVEPLLEEIDCPGVSFEDDVSPWLGNAVAMAAVPGETQPEPVAFVQVTDEDAAVDGIATLAACSPGGAGGAGGADMVGTAFSDGWLVLAETDEQAQAAVDDAAAGSLSEDGGYQRWVEEAGGSGILTAYVAAGAPAAAFDAAEAEGASDVETEAFRGLVDDFEGAAAVLRFDDGALEVESAVGGLPSWTTSEGDSGIGDLPDTTAVALGVAVGDTVVQDVIDAYSEVLGQDEVDQLLAEGEQMTGLDLPEDLQALLGDGFSVALDGSADLLAGTSSPAQVPFGLRINGDPTQVRPALDKVLGALTTFGLPAELVQVQEGDGTVALALSPEHAATLAGDGGLGEQSGFNEALPDVERSRSGLYVGFDDGDWFSSLVALAGDAQVKANTEPLHSLGITGWAEDGTSHGLLRLTTD